MRKQNSRNTQPYPSDHDLKAAILCAKRAGTPTYKMEVGDKVFYGAVRNPRIVEVIDDGLCYIIEYNKNNDSSEPEQQLVAWFQVRPTGWVSTKSFTAVNNVDITNYNITVESMISKHLCFAGGLLLGGIDFNLKYQRDYVWSTKDREALLDSIFLGADIGKFTVRRLNRIETLETGFSYEVIDGKQRMLTIIDYFLNKYPYRGVFFNGLSFEDRRTFMNHPISWGEIGDLSKKDTLRLFLLLNRGGKAASDEVIDQAKSLLMALESD